MANNELSGPIVSMSLLNYFMKKTKLLNEIYFIPETIGSITFINKNFKISKKIVLEDII